MAIQVKAEKVIQPQSVNASVSALRSQSTGLVRAPVVTGAAGSTQPAGVPGTWTLVYEDQFNGPLDTNMWEACWYSNVGCAMGVPANNTFSGGSLVQTLTSTDNGAAATTRRRPGGFGREWGANTVFEARLLLPGNGSQLYNWSAFWVLHDQGSVPNGGNGGISSEIDIVEVLNGQATVNYHGPNGANLGSVPGYWGGAYHTYTCHRKLTSFDVYYDGVLRKSFNNLADGGNGMYILLTCVGGSLGGPEMLGSAGAMRIDRVSVWQ